MKTIIVEDELSATHTLQRMLDLHTSCIKLLGTAADIASAEQLIASVQPDLIFLDVMLHGENALVRLREVWSDTTQIIVVTGHQEFALMAVKAGVADYITKPIDPEELNTAVKKAEKRYRSTEKKDRKQKIIFKSLAGWQLVKYDEIVRVEADEGYASIHLLSGQKHIVTRNLSAIAEVLTEEMGFIRVHKSHLVNFSHLAGFKNSRPAYLVMNSGDQIPVAQRRKDEILDLLDQYHSI